MYNMVYMRTPIKINIALIIHFSQRRNECEDKITNNKFQMTNKIECPITKMILSTNLQFGHSYLIII